MKTKKRSVGRKHRQTRKYSKKGGNNQDVETKALKELRELKSGESIITRYKGFSKSKQQNIFVITSSIKQIVKSSRTQEDRFTKLIELYKVIPNTMKKNPKVIKALLTYEPYILVTNTLPKDIRKQEFAWKTALKSDESVLLLLDKQLQRHILESESSVLEDINKIQYNMTGDIKFKGVDAVLDLLERFVPPKKQYFSGASITLPFLFNAFWGSLKDGNNARKYK